MLTLVKIQKNFIIKDILDIYLRQMFRDFASKKIILTR